MTNNNEEFQLLASAETREQAVSETARQHARFFVQGGLYMSGYTNVILAEHAFRFADVVLIEKPFSLSQKAGQTLKSGGKS